VAANIRLAQGSSAQLAVELRPGQGAGVRHMFLNPPKQELIVTQDIIVYCTAHTRARLEQEQPELNRNTT